MNVKLISSSHDTENRTLIEQVAYVARVSNPGNQNNVETADRLISYLIRNKHWSPFEMVHICLEIETTRDIARQILRHRSFSFQEFSQRYAIADLGWERKETRLQDAKNRQNSVETEDRELDRFWQEKQNDAIKYAKDAYEWAIANGIAKEQARAVLPEGLTQSRLYMAGSLRSWIHYIELRTGNGTQKEHRDVAFACVEAIAPVFSMIKEFACEQ